jgi:hypothetical protein
MDIAQIEILIVGLNESIARAQAVVEKSRQTAVHARDTAEHAKATAEGNNKLFRLFMDEAKRQDKRCEEHRKRTELLERKLARLEAAKGAA